MERILIVLQKASHALLFISLTVASIALAFLVSQVGVIAAYLVIFLFIGLAVLAIIFSDFRNGFLIMVIFAFFIFPLGRLMPFSFPLGTIMEVFYILISLSIMINSSKESEISGWKVFKNPVGYSILLYVGYMLLEFLNPNSGAVAPRFLALREMLLLILLFFIAMHVFSTLKYIYFFTKFWLFLALLVALYALKQEYFGLMEFEMRALYEDPVFFNLVFVWGHIRKWSFLSDVSAFGLFAAYSGIICGILALGPFQTRNRIILAICSAIMLLSMTYSGTRTATVMVVIGFVFYVLLTINNRKTLIFAVISVMAFVLLLYGPFYGPTLTRLRSSFTNTSEDPSMGVRKYKRDRLQPYARSHPFGGGLNTVGFTGLKSEPSHPLAGDYDPDSGYLRMALERGWVGLIVNLGFYAAILISGVINYYRTSDLKIKALYAAYMAGLFSLTIANFAQDAMDQKPIVVIVLCSYAIIAKLLDLDGSKEGVNT